MSHPTAASVVYLDSFRRERLRPSGRPRVAPYCMAPVMVTWVWPVA